MDELRPGQWWRVLSLPLLMVLVIVLALVTAIILYAKAIVCGVAQMLGLMPATTRQERHSLSSPHFIEAGRRAQRL